MHLEPGSFWATILTIYHGNPWVKVILLLLAANVVVGIARSLYAQAFYLGEVGRWLGTRAVPFLLAAGAMQLVLLAALPAELGAFTDVAVAAVWLFAIGEMVGKVVEGLRAMGVPLPAMLGSAPKPETKATP